MYTSLVEIPSSKNCRHSLGLGLASQLLLPLDEMYFESSGSNTSSETMYPDLLVDLDARRGHRIHFSITLLSIN